MVSAEASGKEFFGALRGSDWAIVRDTMGATAVALTAMRKSRRFREHTPHDWLDGFG